MSNQRYSVAVMAEAIKNSNGIYMTIASRLGCTVNTVKRWVERHPTLRELYEHELEVIIGKAESIISRNIDISYKDQEQNNKVVDTSDAKWLLSKKSKKEYGDSLSIEGSLILDIPEGKAEEYLARIEKAIHSIIRND